jgi:ABC-type multidrug transport system ATPase subunit
VKLSLLELVILQAFARGERCPSDLSARTISQCLNRLQKKGAMTISWSTHDQSYSERLVAGGRRVTVTDEGRAYLAGKASSSPT